MNGSYIMQPALNGVGFPQYMKRMGWGRDSKFKLRQVWSGDRFRSSCPDALGMLLQKPICSFH